MIKKFEIAHTIAKKGIAFSKITSICILLARATRNRFSYLYAYLSLNHASKNQNLQTIQLNLLQEKSELASLQKQISKKF